VFEAEQPALLAAWQQDREPGVRLTGPKLLAGPFLQPEQRHRVIPDPFERLAPVGLVDGSEANEPRDGVEEHRFVGLLPDLLEEPPAIAVLRGLDGPALLSVHGYLARPGR
jgi:hypothetical protein